MRKNRRKISINQRAAARRQVSARAMALTILAAACAPSIRAQVNPQGMTVSRGEVTATVNGSRLDITASHNAVIDWQSFNIGAGNTTTFHQPGANSVVWNRINDSNPSQIWGSLNANGWVVLMNQNGFYFGPNASINVGGFVATTASVIPPPDVAGGMWTFTGLPASGQIINHGSINVAKGGSLFLISEHIENRGTLSAPEGTIDLYAGKEVLLSERPDGRGLSASVQLPEGSVDNLGRITAPGGEIALRARVVNQGGVIQADSVRTKNGVIELIASDAINLSKDSLITADGDTAAGAGLSDAGKITIQSAGEFNDAGGSRIQALGGAEGGNGGQMELSATRFPALNTSLDATARDGWTSGSLLFDPYDIELAANLGNASSPESVHSTDSPNNPGDLLTLDVTRAFQTFSNIRLQASHNITLRNNTTWDLPTTTQKSAGNLALEAGNNVIFGDNSRLSAGAWNVSFTAGADFSQASVPFISGKGGIYINGAPPDSNGTAPNFKGALESTSGNITLNAGHEVRVGGGYIRTTAGGATKGNIRITTGDGDVSSGTFNSTYDYSNRGYVVSAQGLGGIGTANGGSVTIHAGQDILSFTAYIGAFGAPAANVTLDAKRDVKGFFLVRNGFGSIDAGRDVGNPSPAATLGLISGGWTVHGKRDVYINEVFNPNGSLNENRLLGAGNVKFQFDYAPDAFAKITGDNSVQLVGNGVLHTTGNSTRQPIYPPNLEVTAGTGGVTLGNDVTLAPAAAGTLKITTTDGGSLQSADGKYAQLIMSDSGSKDYTTFATGHAATPLHAPTADHPEGEGKVILDINGDLKNLFFRSPMAASMFVDGDVKNFAFEGQNLSINDVTTLTIGGNYSSRSDRTTQKLTDVPDLFVLADPTVATNPELGARLSYNDKTGELTVQGILTPDELAFLQNPTQFKINPATNDRDLGLDGLPIVIPAHFSADFDGLALLAKNTRDIPASGLAQAGMQVGGPGSFVISAKNMDLGVSQGIRSVGALKNSSLATIPGAGASIIITLGGNLDVTSSQIASFNGGSISATAQGYMNVGSPDSFTSDDTPKGIYTAHGGNLDLLAGGDILVSGSRIATYDGGNVSVTSTDGNVNAGAGAKGFFSVTTSAVNDDGAVENRNDRFFGSGIMTLTRADGNARVGNVTVKAGKNIEAGAGGILQIPFNTANQNDAALSLDAGGDIVSKNSGFFARNIDVKAGGSVVGLVVAVGNINLHAAENVSVTALAGGSATVSGGGNVSGSIIGGGNVSVAGTEVSAAVISTGGSASSSGESSASTSGAFSSVAATGAQKTTDTADKTVAAQAANVADDEEEKKKRTGAKAPALQRRVSRVTVILPRS